MREIDISKLTGEWKIFAENADNAGDKNKKLDLTPSSIFTEGQACNEYEVFKSIAIANGKSEDDINNFLKEMGVEISTGSQAAVYLKPDEPEIVYTRSVTINAKDSKNQMNYVINQMNKNLVNYITTDGIDWVSEVKNMKSGTFDYASLVEKMKDTSVDWNKVADDLISGLAKNPDANEQKIYDELGQIVKEMASIMTGFKYGSKDDIEIIKNKIDKLKSNLDKTDDMFSKFKSDVLDNFVKIAEEHQKNREFQILKLEYQNLRSGVLADENVLGPDGQPVVRESMSREEAVEAIKKKYKGSYFSKGLISQLENDIVMKEAREEVKNAMFGLRVEYNSDGSIKEGNYPTSASDVVKMSKQYITQDKYTNRVLNGERSWTKKVKDKLDGNRVEIEGFSQYIAAYNRVELAKKQEFTLDELKDIFGVKTSAELQPFLDKTIVVNSDTRETKPLIIDLGNGKYSLANLSDEIKKYASPSDLRVNYQTKSLGEHSEFKNIKTAISPIGTEISNGKVNHLIDIMGFDRDKKNVGFYGRAIYKGSGLGDVVNFLNNVGGATVSRLIANVQSTPATATIVNNFKEVSEALRNQEILFNINVDKSLHFEVNFTMNTIIDGKPVDSNFSLDQWSVYRQLMSQGFTKNDFQLIQDGNTFRLIIDKPDIQSFEQVQTLADLLGENFDLEQDLGLKDDVDLKQGDVKDNFKKAFIANILTQMAINIIKECLRELPGEEDFLQTTITANFLEDYFDELERKDNLKDYPNAKAGLMLLAQQFVKKGAQGEPLTYLDDRHQFDKEGFQKLLEEIAGPKSFMNRFELINGIDIYQHDNPITLTASSKAQEPVLPQETKGDTDKPGDVKEADDKPLVTVRNDTPTDPEPQKVEDTKKEGDITDEQVTGDLTINGNAYLWKDIAKVYPELVTKYGEAFVVRMLKIAQAVTDESLLTEDNLVRLAKLSISDNKYQNKMREIEGLDYNNYMEWYLGTGQVKLPAEFAGCKRNKDKLEQHKAGDAKAKYNPNAKPATLRKEGNYYITPDGKKYNTLDEATAAMKNQGYTKISYNGNQIYPQE